MILRYLSRGARQSKYDAWPVKPVLVRGNWKHPRGRHSPKDYFSFETLDSDVARLLVDKLPSPGQCVKLDRGRAD